MRARVERVKAALAGIDSTPRVFVSEWIEPPYAAGHWVPDMVSLAGGMEVAGMCRAPSHRMRWPDVAELEPDVVAGALQLGLDRTLDEIVTLDVSAHLLGTPARQESRVFAVGLRTATSPDQARVSSTASSSWPMPALGSLLRPGDSLRPRQDVVGATSTQTSPSLSSAGMAAHRLLPVQAGAGLEVEAPAVEGADERRAVEVSLDQRIALVGARRVDRPHAVAVAENCDCAALDLDDRASALRISGTTGLIDGLD